MADIVASHQQARRFSATSIGLPFPPPLTVADADIDVSSRRHSRLSMDLSPLPPPIGQPAKPTEHANIFKPADRPSGLTQFQTFRNFICAMLGPGMFTLPLVFRDGGLIVRSMCYNSDRWLSLQGGFILIIGIGLISNYCMLQLLDCAQRASERMQTTLTIGSVAETVCGHSFNSCRPHRHLFKWFCNATIVLLQIGVCSVLISFSLDHTKEVVMELGGNSREVFIWQLIAAVLIYACHTIRTLKLFAYITIFTTTAMLLSVIYVLQYLVRQSHDIAHLPYFTSPIRTLVAACVALYSFEVQAMILPMEEKLKQPSAMRGATGILSQGMAVTTLVYTLCGFFGYITYGEAVRGSLTLNLPPGYATTSLKALLAGLMIVGVSLQQYPIVRLTYATLRKKTCSFDPDKQPRRDLLVEGAYRMTLVTFEFLLVFLIPSLDLLIAFVGASIGAALALIIPAMFDTLTFAPDRMHAETGKTEWRLYVQLARNGLLALLGLVLAVVGVGYNIYNALKSDDSSTAQHAA